MQADWHCCGITKADDWDHNIYFNSSSSAFRSPEAGGVPFSCCVHSASADGLANLFCGHGVRLGSRTTLADAIYTDGCLPKLQSWLNNNVLYVSVALVVVATVQASPLSQFPSSDLADPRHLLCSKPAQRHLRATREMVLAALIGEARRISKPHFMHLTAIIASISFALYDPTPQLCRALLSICDLHVIVRIHGHNVRVM
jgi:hypothetical protein